jgi:hypothetical protein
MSSTGARAILAASFLGVALHGGAVRAENAASAVARAAAIPPPAGLGVQRVLVTGDGCLNPEEVNVAFSPQGDELVVQYGVGQLGVATGPRLSPEAMGSYCRLQVELRIPPGYAYAITGITHEGYAELDPGVIARRTAYAWFSGMIPPYRTVRLIGPFSGEYHLDSDLGPNPRYSACGSSAPLYLLTTVGLSNLSNPRGTGEMDMSAGGATLRYHLAWRSCG